MDSTDSRDPTAARAGSGENRGGNAAGGGGKDGRGGSSSPETEARTWRERWWVTPVVFGAFGGLAPQILETLQDAEALGVPWWVIPGATGRLGALPIYAVIGAVVAVALRESDMWKAIVLGTSAPAMILNLADGPTTIGLQVLRAQVQGPAAQVVVVEETRPLTIEAQNRLIFDKTVVIHSEQPAKELREAESGSWRVPASAFSMSLKGTTALGNVIVPIETPVIQVPAGSSPIVIRMTMDPQQTAWGGFLDGLGFDRLARERYTDLNPRLVVERDPATLRNPQ